jgi:hypothetical protein
MGLSGDALGLAPLGLSGRGWGLLIHAYLERNNLFLRVIASRRRRRGNPLFSFIKTIPPPSLRAVEDGAAIHSLRLYHEAALFVLDCFPPASRAVAMTR